MFLAHCRHTQLMTLQLWLILLRLSLVLIDVELEAHLVLVELASVAVKLPLVVLHVDRQLAFFDVKSARVDSLLALVDELDLWGGPVGQHVVCLVEEVIEADEVPLYGEPHLVAQVDLLRGQGDLLLGPFQDLSVLVHESIFGILQARLGGIVRGINAAL